MTHTRLRTDLSKSWTLGAGEGSEKSFFLERPKSPTKMPAWTRAEQVVFFLSCVFWLAAKTLRSGMGLSGSRMRRALWNKPGEV